MEIGPTVTFAATSAWLTPRMQLTTSLILRFGRQRASKDALR